MRWAFVLSLVTLSVAGCLALPSSLTTLQALLSQNEEAFRSDASFDLETPQTPEWELALKIDGSLVTFFYDSVLWTNYARLATATEAKTDSYFRSFSQILIRSSYQGVVKETTVPVSGTSLRDLFAGPYLPTSVGVDAWRSFAPNSDWQPNCNKEGFNVQSGGSAVRLGMLYDDNTDCSSPEASSGLGMKAPHRGGVNSAAGNLIGGTSLRSSPSKAVNVEVFIKPAPIALDLDLTLPPVCEGATASIVCPLGSTIVVREATYGRQDATTTCAAGTGVGSTTRTNCLASGSLVAVKRLCEGRRGCDLTASSALFGGDPCAGTSKYIAVVYRCTRVWVPVFSKGSYGTRNLLAPTFNRLFQNSQNSIIRRVCSSCPSTHMDIFYKRVTSPKTFSPYEYFIGTWASTGNTIRVDFNIYSSYSDALTNSNAWGFCNYDSAGVGFPRDCGPSGPVGNTWNSEAKTGQADVAFFVEQGTSLRFWDFDTFESAVDAQGGGGPGDDWTLRDGVDPDIDCSGSPYRGRCDLHMPSSNGRNFELSLGLEANQQASGFLIDEFPFMCTAYRMPIGTKANMVIFSDTLGWKSVTMTAGTGPTYPAAASWNVPTGLITDGQWHYKCVDLLGQIGSGHVIKAVIFNDAGNSQVTGEFWIDDFSIVSRDLSDLCAVANGGCDPLVTCSTSPNGAVCGSCPPGFTNGANNRCTDVNECALAPNGGCHRLTQCVNNVGSYTCSDCPVGYSGSGLTGCTDVDECTVDNGGCDKLTECINTRGSHTCGPCPGGYTGRGDIACIDLDECQLLGNGGCHALSKCTNTPGSRLCSACPSGYHGSGIGTGGCEKNGNLSPDAAAAAGSAIEELIRQVSAKTAETTALAVRAHLAERDLRLNQAAQVEAANQRAQDLFERTKALETKLAQNQQQQQVKPVLDLAAARIKAQQVLAQARGESSQLYADYFMKLKAGDDAIHIDVNGAVAATSGAASSTTTTTTATTTPTTPTTPSASTSQPLSIPSAPVSAAVTSAVSTSALAPLVNAAAFPATTAPAPVPVPVTAGAAPSAIPTVVAPAPAPAHAFADLGSAAVKAPTYTYTVHTNPDGTQDVDVQLVA